MADPVIVPAAAPATPSGPAVDPVLAAGEAARSAANAAVADPAKPTEGVAAPAAKPLEDKVPAALRAVQQREREVQQQRQQLATQAREFDARVAAAVQKAVAEQMGGLKSDPIAAMRAAGFTDEQIASRLLNQGKQTPEELARQALDAHSKLERDLADRDRRAASAQASRDFAEIAKDEAKYPHLVEEWAPEEAVREAGLLVDRMRSKGIDPAQYSYADIAKYLNDTAKARAARRDGIKAARVKKDPAQAGAKAEGNGVPDQGAALGKPATTTLGNGLGERQTMNGKPGHMLTPAELARAVDAEVARTLSVTNGRA